MLVQMGHGSQSGWSGSRDNGVLRSYEEHLA